MIKLIGPFWEIKNIEAVLFDKDGTLIDSHFYWGAIIKRRSKSLIKKLNLDNSVYKSLCLKMGFSLENKKLLPKGPIALVSREEVIKILFEHFNKNNKAISEKEISELFLEINLIFLKEIYKYIKILPGSKKTILKLKKKGAKTALITYDSIKNTSKIIQYLGLQNCFDLLMGKESTLEPKITGIPAIKACEYLKVNPQNTVCIGDAPIDILMAKRAKLKACISIALGQTPYKELQKKTEYVIKDYSELIIK